MPYSSFGMMWYGDLTTYCGFAAEPVMLLSLLCSHYLLTVLLLFHHQELVGMVVKKAVKMANMMNLIIGLLKTTAIWFVLMRERIEVFGKSRGHEGATKRKSLFGSLPIDHKLANFCDEG